MFPLSTSICIIFILLIFFSIKTVHEIFWNVQNSNYNIVYLIAKSENIFVSPRPDLVSATDLYGSTKKQAFPLNVNVASSFIVRRLKVESKELPFFAKLNPFALAFLIVYCHQYINL